MDAQFQKHLANGQMSAKWRNDKIDLLLKNKDKLRELQEMTGIDNVRELRNALVNARIGVIIKKGASVLGIKEAGLSGADDIYRLVE